MSTIYSLFFPPVNVCAAEVSTFFPVKKKNHSSNLPGAKQLEITEDYDNLTPWIHWDWCTDVKINSNKKK